MNRLSKWPLPGSLIALLFSQTGCQVQQPAMSSYYAEQYRPQFHFSPEQKWMNDPNGMVYYDGEYHLFYQYYPDSTVWGPMHWGHAVSKDLLHWQHLPIALYPDSLGYIFSGSAVIDWHNTTGFQTGGHPPMVSIFTQHSPSRRNAGRIDYQNQSIAYSNDRGRTWTMYTGNPVIRNPGIEDFRDPKVFWHASTGKWIMVMAAGDRVRFYGSGNLREWEFLSEFGTQDGNHGGVWECPDLFPLRVDGSDETKWVLLVSINPGAPNGGSGTQYFIGDFDGREFRNSNRPAVEHWIDYGRDDYAGVTWSDIPESDGRRLFIGWMSNWQYAQVVPTQRWRNAMTLPRSLSLFESPSGLLVKSRPVRELLSLRGERSLRLDNQQIDGNLAIEPVSEQNLFEAVLEFDLRNSASPRFGLELANGLGERYRFGFDQTKGRFFSDRRQGRSATFSETFAAGQHFTPPYVYEGKLKMHAFVDKSSIEVFVDDGAVVMTEIFFPTEDFDVVRLYSDGKTILIRAEFFELQSIWGVD